MTTLPQPLVDIPEPLAGITAAAPSFVDRRSNGDSLAGTERRQFANSHKGLSPDARELAEAIDSYKIRNRRRYITFEEMLRVIHSLGYEKR